MARPGGSVPLSLYVRVSAAESVPDTVTAAMGVPDGSVCAPGLDTVTEFWIVQEKVAEPVKPSVSVAVMVVE